MKRAAAVTAIAAVAVAVLAGCGAKHKRAPVEEQQPAPKSTSPTASTSTSTNASTSTPAPRLTTAATTRFVSHLVNGKVEIEEVAVEPAAAATVAVAAQAPAAPDAAPESATAATKKAEIDPRAIEKLLAAASAEGDLDTRIALLEREEKALPAVFAPRTRAPIFAAIGDAYELQNDGLHALYAYEKASDLNAIYQRRLEDIRKKQGVEKYFTGIRNEHFAGMFEGDADKELAQGALAILDEGYRRLGERLDVRPTSPVTVIFYTSDKFDQTINHPDWSGGVFDGKIRVSKGEWHLNHGEVKNLLWHEYTHALVRTLPVTVPVWFNEGLAQHEEETPSRSRVNQLKQPGGRKLLPSLATLSGGGFYGRTRNNDEYGANIGYACGLDLVDFLAEMRGESSLRDLLGELKDQKPFPDAVADVYGISMEQLESKWRDRFAE